MKLRSTLLLSAVAVSLSALAGGLNVRDGNWSLTFDKVTHTLTYGQDGKTIVKGASVGAICGDDTHLDSRDYPKVSLKKEKIDDGYGKGKRYSYTYSGLEGKPALVHNIYVYPSLPYILVEAVVQTSDPSLGAYEICPIVSTTATDLALPETDNYVYDMPFANDNWATYNATLFGDPQDVTSCEATVLYNAPTREGLVIGSVDHSTWKSGISVETDPENAVNSLCVKAGYISPRTWDVMEGKASSTRHGTVKGNEVPSPRFMVGYFDDWRDGLETYGDANTIVCPKLRWDKDEALFGWQSWGGMEFGLNYKSAMSVLDFFEKELLPLGFHNSKGRCHMVLDSGWNALTDEELRAYTEKCKKLGIVAGIYTTPFSYWGGEDQCKNNVAWEGGHLGEMVIKSNGRYRQINAMSLDPTHPAVKEWNRKSFEKFRDLGFEFVKIDFMNNGSQEADAYYLPDITTGMQAYNYGMDYIVEFAGDMMLDFSIAPVFPAKAHVRRIGCDAWGDLPQSMYTLNCINGSWWLDRVYAFNDPDHMCLSRVEFNHKGSHDEQEARIRYTCGLLTGMTLFGGTYAYEGDVKNLYGKDVHMVGYDAERRRAVKFASNRNLTEMGRIGRTFRPVEGTYKYKGSLWSQEDIPVDNEFILDTDKAFYYVVFNYGTDSAAPLTKRPDFERLGVSAADFDKVTEIWEGKTFLPTEFEITVPAKDVRIYRFEKPGYQSLIQQD